MSTEVDLAVLGDLARRLRGSGDTLDATGGGAPVLPDAGEMSGLIAEVLAHLSEGAGNLAVGLKEAADRVDATRTGYATQDENAAATFRGYF